MLKNNLSIRPTRLNLTKMNEKLLSKIVLITLALAVTYNMSENGPQIIEQFYKPSDDEGYPVGRCRISSGSFSWFHVR